ncbi:hypothetical protein [Terrabacter sp. NPDC080008]|uniref:hypothetical protein n=1 Tax=Terrabacter sp. NPDC080008 TaxID=3155176 RepID=UPI00344E0750
MSTVPDSDIRAALDEATHVDGLRLDPEAVLLEGHRVVRRRRIATAGLAVAATAVVAVVAVQLGGGQPRALPAVGPSSSATVVATALDESAQLSTNGSSEILSGPGIRLRLRSTSAGKVEETWEVLEFTKAVRTVRREVPRPGVGGSSLLLPSEGGLPGAVVGWVDTGSPRTLNVRPVSAPPDTSGEADTTTRLVASGGGGSSTRHLFIAQINRLRPDSLVGVVWSDRLDDADPMKLRLRAALTGNPRPGIDRAVLTAPNGDQWVAWADEGHFGLLSMRGALPGPDGSGPLRVLPVRGSTGLETTPDLVFGWAKGTGSVTATSSDPADHFVVSSNRAGGQTAFVVAPAPPSLKIKGAVTVTAGGASTTVNLAAKGRG